MAAARLLLLAALAGVLRAAGEVVVAGGEAGPKFAARQRTQLVAATGQTVEFECRVTHLGDKAVSWVRARDLVILSHAGVVFTADARVSAARRPGPPPVSVHALRLQRLRPSDSGRYECQLNTEPKMSLFYNLTVIDEEVPRVVVRAGEGEVVVAAGGAATLSCVARYDPAPRALPMPPLEPRWHRWPERTPLTPESRPGGVSLETERWASRAESRLTLPRLTPSDAGTYVCTAGTEQATVELHVATGTYPWETELWASRAELRLTLPRLTPSDAGTHVCTAGTEQATVELHVAIGTYPWETELWASRAELRLTLPRLTPSDAGTHVCTAGTEQATVELHVAIGTYPWETERWGSRAETRLTLPRLTPNDAGTHVCTAGTEQTTVELHVAIGTYPWETERWASRAESCLTLPRLTPSDAGTHVCTAGTEQATVELHVATGTYPWETELWASRAESCLTLPRLTPSDASTHVCTAGTEQATVELHVATRVTRPNLEERMEMQRDAASGVAHLSPGPILPVLVPLLLALSVPLWTYT